MMKVAQNIANYWNIYPAIILIHAISIFCEYWFLTELVAPHAGSEIGSLMVIVLLVSIHSLFHQKLSELWELLHTHKKVPSLHRYSSFWGVLILGSALAVMNALGVHQIPQFNAKNQKNFDFNEKLTYTRVSKDSINKFYQNELDEHHKNSEKTYSRLYWAERQKYILENDSIRKVIVEKKFFALAEADSINQARELFARQKLENAQKKSEEILQASVVRSEYFTFIIVFFIFFLSHDKTLKKLKMQDFQVKNVNEETEIQFEPVEKLEIQPEIAQNTPLEGENKESQEEFINELKSEKVPKKAKEEYTPSDLKILREEEKWKIQEIHEYTGMPVGTVHNWLNGKFPKKFLVMAEAA